MTLANGCVMQLRCNDNAASTTVVNSAGSTDGTFVAVTGDPNTDAHTTAGKINTALNFDGTDDYIDTGDAFQLTFRGSFSISYWLKPDDGHPSPTETILAADNTIGDNIGADLLTNGGIRFRFTSNGITAFADTLIAFNDGAVADFHHIVLTAEADTILRTYFDTVAGGTVDASGLTFADFTSATNIFIGAYNADGSASGFFAGDIDNVMIFNRALSPEEIQRLYNSGHGSEDLREFDNKNYVERWNTSELPLRKELEL